MTPPTLPLVLARLRSQGHAIESLCRAIPPADAARPPAPGKWTLLEILCHLADEEREDFRARLRSVIEDPARPWPRIDPQGWVAARNYAARDWSASIDDFAAERAASLAWLATIDTAALDNVYRHPKRDLSGHDLLASWLAHDLLHLRQIARALYLLQPGISAGEWGYAGEW